MTIFCRFVATAIRPVKAASGAKSRYYKYGIVYLDGDRAKLLDKSNCGPISSLGEKAQAKWRQQMIPEVGDILSSRILMVDGVECEVTAMELKHPFSAVAFSYYKAQREPLRLLFQWCGSALFGVAWIYSLCSSDSDDNIRYVLVASKESGPACSTYLTRRGYFELALEFD